MTLYVIDRLLEGVRSTMGTYDEIKCNFSCPVCKHRGDKGMQTKEGPRMLNTYKTGDIFHLNKCYKKQKDIDGNNYISLLGSCSKCGIFIDGYARLDPKTLKIKQVDIHRYHQTFKTKIVSKR
jgi:hypothetical protein